MENLDELINIKVNKNENFSQHDMIVDSYGCRLRAYIEFDSNMIKSIKIMTLNGSSFNLVVGVIRLMLEDEFQEIDSDDEVDIVIEDNSISIISKIDMNTNLYLVDFVKVFRTRRFEEAAYKKAVRLIEDNVSNPIVAANLIARL